MNKIVLLSFSVLLFIGLGCSKAEIDEYAMVTFTIGDVTKNSVNLEINEIIKEKDIIITGADAFCDLKIGDSIVRIKEKSKVVISSLLKQTNMEKTTLDLGVGKMLCKPKKLLKSDSFIVKTPTAVAGVRGTKFIVEADASKTTRIKVFDGKIKIAKRIKQFETNIDKVLEAAPVVSKEEKIIITKKEVIASEKIVEKALLKNKDVEIAKVIEKTKKEVVVSKKNIEKFAIEDFQAEKKEMIDVKKKPKEVIRKIVKVLKQEKQLPIPEGRLLVTKYEIYFIKDGKVQWEGKVVNNPIKQGNKLYVASEGFVFCATSDGPVQWKKRLDSNGSLKIENGKLIVGGDKKSNILDITTGDIIK